MIRWKKTYWGDSTMTIFIIIFVTILLIICIYVAKRTTSSSTDNSIPLNRKPLYDIMLENEKLAFLYKTEFIAIMFALWFLVIAPILGILGLYLQKKRDEKFMELYQTAEKAQKKYYEIGCDRYDEITKLVEQAQKDFAQEKDEMNQELASIHEHIVEQRHTEAELQDAIIELTQKEIASQKQLETQKNRIKRIKDLYKSVVYCIDNRSRLTEELEKEIIELQASETLEFHCMDVKSLRKAYRKNDKQITKLTERYSARYTTKANKAIYQLMTIALRSELQNILYSLKYSKLDEAIEKVKAMTAKYLSIAGNGNQSIAGTLTSFIGELEYFFLEAVKIEYNYYVKKEQARQEQLAIREQMRQEAAERKALADAKKKVEQEEEKYKNELSKLNQQLNQSSDEEATALRRRILELEKQLSDVTLKKEEISNLQNGKAGNVYIISNLGSFGRNIFKIGMTRRLDPQDRVNELGSASVPFKFDVHSFIFSDDAVALENKLHQLLNEKRVNKVNLRKEFFYTSVKELEQIVADIDPTAEFKKTMVAEEFRQSQNNVIYKSIPQPEDSSSDLEDEDEDENE